VTFPDRCAAAGEGVSVLVMKSLMLLAVLSLVACGGKKSAPAAPASSASTETKSDCCCDVPTPGGEQPSKSVGFVTADACKAQGGTCDPQETECHGIEGPIPDGP
jgi:hypothetical protein